MQLAIHGIRDMTEEQARYIRQLGIRHVNLNQYRPSLPGDVFAYDDLCRLREKMEGFGFTVPVLENIPPRFYDKIMLGQPGRERQLDNLRETIRNIGRAGIPVFGFHFMPTGVWRTNRPLSGHGASAAVEPFDPRRATPDLGQSQYAPPRVGRGGAAVGTFDGAVLADSPPVLDRVFPEDEIWDNFTYFIRGIMPAAEEVGLKVSLHPDDPPVPMLGGIGRPFRSLAGFRRATEIADSPLFGVTFCLGNWALMGIEELRAGLQWFGARGLIHYVHFQAVRGAADRFEETFFDESDVFFEVLKALRTVDFRGVIVPGHAPVMGPPAYPSEVLSAKDLMGLTHSIGVVQGMLHALERM